MTNRRLSLRVPALAVAVSLGAALLTPSGSALADPVRAAAEAGPSAIADGMMSSPVDYQSALFRGAAADPADPVDVEDIEDLGETVCAPLQGEVTQADIDAVLGPNPPPTGAGRWEYEVCAEDADRAHRIAAAHPTVDAARRYCGPPYDGADVCGVFAHWRPDVSVPTPADPGGRKSYLDSLDNFAPVLGTSPAWDADHGVIANLPTWFWNTVVTDWPKAVPGVGTAWHLRTTFQVNGQEVCRVSGLHKVGTVYRPGADDPSLPSPSDCGHTFTNQGRYDVRGCTRWLFILDVLAIAPVIFTATFCNTDVVPVKETQVVTGGDPRRRRVG